MSPQQQVEEIVSAYTATLRKTPLRRKFKMLRKLWDVGLCPDVPSPESRNLLVEAVDHPHPGMWVYRQDADTTKRLLYLHGGGFICGSPRGHRSLIYGLAERTDAAIFALDYRLIPEHRRLDGIQDCQQAMAWLAENGPQGPSPAESLFVGGDSAGGNLALMLSAWSRDRDVRKPDAVFSISPALDMRMLSPTYRNNLNSDLMLRDSFKWLVWLPKFARFAFMRRFCRTDLLDPIVSPISGDLSRLPPTLLHASDVEIVVGDAERYVQGAQAVGSPVEITIWPGMVHVFQLFEPILPEARKSLDEIAAFLKQHENNRAAE